MAGRRDVGGLVEWGAGTCSCWLESGVELLRGVALSGVELLGVWPFNCMLDVLA